MCEGKSRTLFAKYAIPRMIGLVFISVYMIVDVQAFYQLVQMERPDLLMLPANEEGKDID